MLEVIQGQFKIERDSIHKPTHQIKFAVNPDVPGWPQDRHRLFGIKHPPGMLISTLYRLHRIQIHAQFLPRQLLRLFALDQLRLTPG
jgi:hypothetical protein